VNAIQVCISPSDASQVIDPGNLLVGTRW
jgi:hypothetical protein